MTQYELEKIARAMCYAVNTEPIEEVLDQNGFHCQRWQLELPLAKKIIAVFGEMELLK